ncbi:uncharacterized protein LOC130732279 [Lotus japonicus]|uniref:uncharacterized protein LOC130732279 n=1 Tax=Lotus japonicus TaxID=34305 RepID=UPI002582DF94|nr:uncharacterized protein LOC130732279 [Lotus japonicus]
MTTFPTSILSGTIGINILGTKIHATIKKTLMYKFEGKVLEDKVISLAYLEVVNNSGQSKTNRHELKLIKLHDENLRSGQ